MPPITRRNAKLSTTPPTAPTRPPTRPPTAPTTASISTIRESFSRCDFVNTEINHDLNPPISVSTSNKSSFKEIVALNLDENGSPPNKGCNNKTTTNNILNDDNIVEKITGKSRSFFSGSSLVENVNHPFEPLLMNPTFSNTESLRINGVIRPTIMKISKKNYTMTLLNLFELSMTTTTTARNPENIYFIIDTGDDLINKLKETHNPNNHINLHIIHSVLTIADSASKTRPDSINYVKSCYNKTNKSMNSYSWLYQENWNINSNNEVFMSMYNIKNTLNPKWKILQEWYLRSPQIEYTTNDAHKDNNRTIIKNKLSPLIGKSSLNVKEKKNMNINFQKKRSGDYLQILAAKKMPEILALPTNETKFKYCRGPFLTKSSNITGMSEKYYYDRTYFVTGDWPAMSYAIYNKVNCIMIVRDKDPLKTFIIRIKFN